MSDDGELESLANRLRDVQLQLGMLKAEETSLKGLIYDKVRGELGVITAFGKPVLRLEYGKRFDPKLADEVLAAYPNVLNTVSKSVVDAALAKAILPPALYAQCQKNNAQPTIQVVSAS